MDLVMFDKWVQETMTYGQRLELGTLFNKEKDENVLAYESYKIIYEEEPTLVGLVAYIKNEFPIVIEGLAEWINLEGEYLHYEPSPEEISAGINNLKCPLSTAVSIGKDYGLMPNEVLKRPYSEIFMILWSNAEVSKFERRLNKIYNRK